MDMTERAGLGCVLGSIVIAIGAGAALTTHVVVCIKTESWILLLAGILAFPVGIIHGVGHWFGAW